MYIVFQSLFWLSLLGLAYGLYRYLFPPQWQQETAVAIKGRKESYYNALLVDNVSFHHGAYFSGLEVSLPKPLPHIFLDARRNDRSYNSQLLLDNGERMQLEGDFGNYFELFVKKEYHRLALTILTPDVMRAMVDLADDVDIEIHGSKLRLITRRGLRTRLAEQQALLRTAELLVAEIDHKMRSWHEPEHVAESSSLRIVETGIVKVGRARLSKAMLGVSGFLVLVAAPFWVGGSLYMASDVGVGLMLLCGGFFFFPVSYFAIRQFVRSF